VTRRKKDLLHGTLDLLILKTLDLEPLHGWALSKRIQFLSDDVLKVGQGSLYPALHRLRDRGLITSKWEISDGDQRVRVYRLTRTGREVLSEEREVFRLFVGAVERILETT
jgi:transcriptional regulator